ncbi:MAG: hypothetical protein V1729_03735 [Candidatus Woesearchaeota archaeon]
MRKSRRETSPVTDKAGRHSIKLFTIMIVALLAMILISNAVMAIPFGNALSGLKDKVGGALGSYASNDAPGVFDLFIFMVIFFSLCWIGFSAVFKDAKNANVVLSLALGVALAVAMVYGGKVGLVKLLPFAGLILFIIVFVLIYALLNKFIFTKGGAMSKILTAVLAVIISIALIMVAWNTICDSGSCENNAFMQKLTGTGSVFGKMMYKMDNIFSGVPIPSPPPGSPSRPDAIALKTELCGNGLIDSGELCDPRASPNGCTGGWFEFNQLCDSCNRCDDQSTTGAIYDTATGSWYVYLPMIIIFSLMFWKRKDLKERYKKRKQRKINKKGVEALEKALKTIEDDEKSMLDTFKHLCEAIRSEKTIFQESRHIVEEITTDIKETIGGEREFIKQADAGQGGNISRRVDQLIVFNNTEKHLITGDEGIIHKINEQLKKLEDVPQELQDEINALEGALEHFEDHDKILQTFKQHDFTEKNVLVNMAAKLKENKDGFTRMTASCNSMIETLNSMHAEIKDIVMTDKIDYPTIRRHIRDIRDNAIKLNKAFSEKIALLHQIMHRLQEIKEEIIKVHEEEKSRAVTFCSEARFSYEKGKFDSAIYLASHVIEIVDNLMGSVIDPKEKEVLKGRAEEAIKIIEESLPKLFASMKDEIQNELDKGEFEKVILLTEHIGKIEFIRDEFNDKFSGIRKEYQEKIEDLRSLCEKMKKSSESRKKLIEDIGAAPKAPSP